MSKIRRCIVCTNTNRTATDVSYFRIPLDQDYAEKWFVNLGRLDLFDSFGGRNASGFICSDHFPPDRMFLTKSNEQFPVRRLKRGALPYKITDDGRMEDPTSEKSDDDADDGFDCSIADMIQRKMFTDDDPSRLDSTTNGYADNEMSTNDINEAFILKTKKTSTERVQEFRARQRAKRQLGMDPTSINTSIEVQQDVWILKETSTDFNLDLFDDVDPKEIEQYKTHFPNLEKIADSKSHCTSCQYHIGTAPINEAIIKMHPILRVTQCKRCFTFYNSGEFERGEDGSELYCRWCGQGGEVYCCSNCPYVFCRRCIIHNLSRNMVTEIQNNENWNCFACAPQCMIPLRASHWALVNFIEKQKRHIINQSSDEKEINELMSKDIARCCNNSKKRSTLKRKVDNTAVISPPPEKKKSIAPTPSPKILNAATTRKSIESNVAPKEDDSIVVQCTPDILSLFNTEEQAASPASNNQAVEAPPLRLIRREVTIRPNQTITTRPTPPPQQPTPSPRQPTPPPRQKTPLPPPPQPSIQSPSPITTHIATTTSNPVYHTINGFRIDLNTAAQQETYRLPNGKLIQVKKQTPSVTQPNSTPPERSSPVVNRPPMLPTRPPSLPPSRPPSIPPNRPQLTAARSLGTPAIRVSRPQFQMPQRQPVQIQTRFVGNQQIRMMNGPTIQQLNAPQQQMNPNHPPPLVLRSTHGDSPVGKARTQFEERVDSSMEVCQHIIAKINTLTNSSSYKKVKSFMDLKDLTVHLSYLLTYAIGRFKTLQEKCIEDMKNMGFNPENKGNPASDDDDVEIVETKTTTINLDSDEEDGMPTESNNNDATVASLSNGVQNNENIAPQIIIQACNLMDDLNTFEIVTVNNNTEDQVNNTANNNNVEDDLIDVIDEPMDVTETEDEKSAEKDANNSDYIQVVEITENEEEKNENDISESLDQTTDEDTPVEVAEEPPSEIKENIEKEDNLGSVSESIETATKVANDNEESVEEVTEISKISEKEDVESESKQEEPRVEDILSKDTLTQTDATLKMVEAVVSKDNNETLNQIIPEKLAENIDEDKPEAPAAHNDDERIPAVASSNNDDEMKSDINKVVDNIQNESKVDSQENASPNKGQPEENITDIASESLTSENSLKITENNPESLDKKEEQLEENVSEVKNNEKDNNDETPSTTEDKEVVEPNLEISKETISDEVPAITEDKTAEPISDLSEESIADEIKTNTEDKTVGPVPDISEVSITEVIPVTSEDKTVEPILDLSEKSIADEIKAVTEDKTVGPIPDLFEESIAEVIPVTSKDKTVRPVPDLSEESIADEISATSVDRSIEPIPDLPEERIAEVISVTSEDKTVEAIPDFPEESIADEIPATSEDRSIEPIPDLPEESIADEIPLAAIEHKFAVGFPDLSEKETINKDEATVVTEDKIVEMILEPSMDTIIDQISSLEDKISDLPETNIEDEISSIADIPDVPEESIIDAAISDILGDKTTDNICLPDDIDDCMGESNADDDKDSSSALLDDIIMKTLEMEASV